VLMLPGNDWTDEQVRGVAKLCGFTGKNLQIIGWESSP